MRLNMDIIYDELSHVLEIKRFGHTNENLTLYRPMFYQPGGIFQTDRVYIANPATLPAIPPLWDGLLICVGQPGQDWLTGRPAVLVVEDDVKLPEVFNLLQKAFDRYDTWEEELRKILEQDADVLKMVQQSIEIFDNPITVTDKELKVLAVNFWNTQENSESGWTIESGHTVPPEIVAQVRDIYQQGKKKQTELQWFDYNELPGQEERVFRVNLLHGGLYEGCVSLSENRRSFRPGDFVLLQNFAEYIKRALQKLTLINSESLISTRAMLKNLLDCIPVDTNRLQQALQMDARASPTLPEQWVCLKLHISTPEQIHSVEHVRVALENALPGARAIIHDSEPVVFLPDDAQEKLTLHLDAAVSALTGLNIQIGVSFSFQDITAARIYYRQACCALETGIQIAPQKKIYRFDEMLIPYMLIHSRGEFDYDSILSKDLVRLRQYSHDHAADYWKTLRVYLDNEMNAAQTAKDLYLSRSTLLLRLERINKLLGVSLQTARERLYIRICLHMRDCLTASESGDFSKE